MSRTADTFDLLGALLHNVAPGSIDANAHADNVGASIAPTQASEPTRYDAAFQREDAATLAGNHALTFMQSAEMERLRALLIAPEQQRIAALETQIALLQAQLQESDRFVAMISPIVGQAISQRVRESRDEMAEALSPVIGRSVARAVQQAISDLARSIDQTMRRSLRPQFAGRIGARLRGVDPAEAALRAALPFRVRELLLIHRESGLLIVHMSNIGTLTDADLIGSMLSAIRSYVQDSFAPQAEGSLDAISYGDLRVLIEDGNAAVLAVVLQGTEPTGFQQSMRQQLSELHAALGAALRSFDGTPLNEQLFQPFFEPLIKATYVPAQNVSSR